MKYKVISALLAGILAAGVMSIEAQATEIKQGAQVLEGVIVPDRIHAVNSGVTNGSVLMRGGVQEYLHGVEASVAEITPEQVQAQAAVSMTAVSASTVLNVDIVQGEGIVAEQECGLVSEYSDLALAKVTNYVNVRKEANTGGEIVGKIYNGAVAHVLEAVDGEDGEWFKIISGSVEGYIKSEFFLYGDAAAEVIDNYVTRYAVVQADRLNVRSAAGVESKRIGYIVNGEKVQLLEDDGDWLKVQYTEEKTGFVAAEFVTISEEFIYAKTLEEEAAELAAKKALEERQKVSETQVAENTTISVTAPTGDYSDVAELRNAIIEYAKQFLGNKYVNGGRSLVTGTDCSGFTSLIYAEFGYSLGRTPGGQFTDAGRSVDYSEAQPGDIVCYGKNGRCTHVALYMGNGQIIHSANSRKGVITAGVEIEPILGFKRIVE